MLLADVIVLDHVPSCYKVLPTASVYRERRSRCIAVANVERTLDDIASDHSRFSVVNFGWTLQGGRLNRVSAV
jgi:hypothetical protein